MSEHQEQLGAELSRRFAGWAAREGILPRITEEQAAGLARAFIAGALTEREAIRLLAGEKQATYWVGPDDLEPALPARHRAASGREGSAPRGAGAGGVQEKG